jgi:glycosyltransferase involved in cell wall biosynthesis
MRIGIDARELCGRTTGVGRYLAGLLAEWSVAARARQHEFVLYAPDALTMPIDTRRFATRIVGGSPGTWWEQVRVPRVAAGDHIDAWFAPAYTAPLRLDVPIVVAVHDLSYVAHPEWFRIREGVRRRWLTRQSVAVAARVITISEFSKRELIDRLDVPQSKIAVIPPGVAYSRQSPVASRQSAVISRQSAVVGPRPNVLYVGSVFNRRHVSDLIRAFAPIARRHSDASLDLVGDNRTYPREDPRQTVAAEGLDAQVRWHEYVSDDQLRDLYAQARAFAFLSEYEGLGLTPLEALAAGVPPVLLDTAVARESCQDAALYVPLGDLPATTRALEQLLFDDETRARIVSAAPGALSKYQWPRAADETLRVIEAARSD